MRKKRTFKLPEGGTTAKKFVCGCGYELVFHTDMEFVLPKKCPKCKQFNFKGDTISKEVLDAEDNVEEHEREQAESA